MMWTRRIGIAIGLLALGGLVGWWVRSPVVPDEWSGVSTDVRVLAYNIALQPWEGELGNWWWGALDWEGNRNECRAVQLGKRIRTVDADVVLLVEAIDASADTTLRYLQEEFPYTSGVLPPGGSGLHYVYRGGLAVLSRYPFGIQSEGGRVTYRTYDAYSGVERRWVNHGFVHVLLDLSDDVRLNVLVTHLDSYDDPADQAARAAQVGELLAYVKTNDDILRWPTVMGGDFNVDGMPLLREDIHAAVGTGTAELRIIPKEYQQVVGALEHETFVDMLLAARHGQSLHNAPLGTWLCEHGNLVRCRPPRHRAWLDYLFFRETPLATGRVIHAEILPFEANACGVRYLSDHAAVVAHLRVWNQKRGAFAGSLIP